MRSLWVVLIVTSSVIFSVSAYADKSINSQFAMQVMRKAMPEAQCQVMPDDQPFCRLRSGKGSLEVFSDAEVMQGTLDYDPNSLDDGENKLEAELAAIPVNFNFSTDQVRNCFDEAKNGQVANVANNDFKLECSFFNFDAYRLRFRLRVNKSD
jgi:hypothetical protein